MSASAETGLCGHCRHARRIDSASGSAFIQCQLSAADPRFAKWPRLPVLSCAGHEPGEGEAVV
jgi:hypothetical protein